MDLVCLVADRSIEATVQGLLGRPHSLGIRTISFETLVHPNRDPGCLHQWRDLLNGYRNQARYALILLDRAWEGAPAEDGLELERRLERDIAGSGSENWARAVVIDPELEAWVFSESPHVETTFGWTDRPTRLRDALAAQGLWPAGNPKPPDPKAAVQWALRQARTPLSSSLYRELARRVSFERCQDRSFLRLRTFLAGWFGPSAAYPFGDS